MALSAELREHCLALVWSLWVELGVAGWGRRHAGWWIDPEPLIAFTAQLTDTDTRLRDESLDWCVRYGRYVSVVRLRNLWRGLPAERADRLAAYATTVQAHGGFGWPYAAAPYPYEPTGRSKIENFARPALISLRLRAVLGVSARAEIVRAVATRPDAGLTAADLTDEVGYAKRNVAAELDSLRQGALLRVERARNQLRYRPRDPGTLLAFVGERPAVVPPWSALFGFLEDALALASAADAAGMADLVRAVEASRLLRTYEGRLAGVRAPSAEPAALWATFADWLLDLVRRWAEGDPIGLTP